jgi:proteasome lid subunit RPN8/RPN11
MIRHSQTERPKEACGILAGRIDEDGARISKVYECQNVHPNPTVEYLISPQDQVRVFEEIEEEEEIDLVGFYHSHPQGPETPSQIDSSRNYWPGYFIAVVSLTPEPKVSFWNWKEGRFLRQRVVGERF